MEQIEQKCVAILDCELPVGVIANTSAFLGLTLGKLFPELIGHDVTDAAGNTHAGILTIPVTVLRSNKHGLKELRQKLYRPEHDDLSVVDFSNFSQSIHIYSDFADKVSAASESDQTYLGIAILGNKKKVSSLTGSMPLLR
jgi:hypothetical protein